MVSDVKRIAMAAIAAAFFGAAGCGGGSDSGYTEDEVAQALDLQFEGNDNLYTLQDGRQCIVTQVLTSSDEVDQANETSGDVDSAVATNSDGTAGVAFGGSTGFSPDDCVADAESDLNALPSS